MRDYPDSVYKHVDYVIPNEHEAAHLTGLPTDKAVDAVEAARALVARGAGCVIITRGSKGSVWAHARRRAAATSTPCSRSTPWPPATRSAAGWRQRWPRGSELHRALHWASAAGALATTVEGAVPSLPRREAVEALVATTPH